MIPSRAILHTMTSIRLAGEVVNYLSKEAWEQYRKQNRVTTFFEKKRIQVESSYSGSSTQRGRAFREKRAGIHPQNDEPDDAGSHGEQYINTFWNESPMP